ncbi:DUF881 domain-containing protein [Streptomyces sp. RKAG337]|uniref:DUF881 domain-containing protein n=1 Tax=Streptomyces sp. RKAG337 TaxID=2893404 RepID=UPI002034A1A2|nr:DUF881 domain-containing protein [Streptomyces sp. RKAG337]MCM2429896.1 DUF881 domain-containing protein [Streptomyces sp. RKAG337]
MSDEELPERPVTPESGGVPESAGAPERADTPGHSGAPEPDDAPARPGKSLPPEVPAAPAPGPGPAKQPASGETGRQRLLAGLWPPRLSRAQLIVALLLFVLGLGLAIQVRSTSDSGALRGARQEDLVRILTELDNRTQRLQDEKRRLETQRSELETSSNQAEEARKQTEQKAQQLGVLAGTVAAQGPGINLTIADPKGGLEADKLLDTLQELRAAGAEAIQINDVRVVADTYFTQGADGIEIDGHKVVQPYRFKVIGNPQDLEPALNIPGGVVQTLKKEQATADVVRSEKIVVDALRPSKQPDYARSSSQ